MLFGSLVEPSDEAKRWVLDQISNQTQLDSVVKEIIAEYKNREVELPNWMKEYPQRDQEEYKELKKQELLADRLWAYFKERMLIWNIANDKNEAIALDAGLIFVLQKLHSLGVSRYIGGKTYNYVLIVFECGEEIFILRNFCDEPCYDSHSYRIPVMDLYDVTVSGQRRKPKVAHVCGLSGFDATRGDSCTAC